MPKISLLPQSETIEVHRASANKEYDRYITSIVKGWRVTYVLGSATKHTDIIPGSTIARTGSRLVILHPLQESDCEGLGRGMMRAIYSDLDRIQWISHKHHTWLPEMEVRTQSMRALSAVHKGRLFPQLSQDDFMTEPIRRLSNGKEAENAQKRPEANPLPGKVTKPTLDELPEQLFVHRLWRVLNGRRSGIWLCEFCELSHDDCLCPPDSASNKDRDTIFDIWFATHDYVECEFDEDDPRYKRPDTEEWRFVAWREDGNAEMFLDRSQFGRAAQAAETSDAKEKDDGNEEDQGDDESEDSLDVLMEQIRQLEVKK